MKLTDLIEELFVRNGQYIICDLDDDNPYLDALDMTMGQFWAMTKREFYEFQRYFPLTKQFNIQFSRGVYDFTGDPNNVGYSVQDDVITPGTPPLNVGKVTPVSSSSGIIYNGQFSPPFSYGLRSMPGPLVVPSNIKAVYRNPLLYLYPAYDTRCDIIATYKYQVIFTETESVLTEVEMVGIAQEEEKYFVDLMSGRFLQMIGRQRAAFDHEKLQILMDGEQCFEAGVEEHKLAKEALLNNNPWWLSITP